MNILLNGICGYMGREVEKLCVSGYRGARLVMGVDPLSECSTVPVYKSFQDIDDVDSIDCIVDFSHHSSTPALLQFAKANNIECEVSLENMMACGLGACLCCVEKTVKGNVCVCKEGPVFNINDLTWQI
jgi:hypothetical protein